MNKPATVTCVGELIVDFIPAHAAVDLEHTPGFLKYAGGAAANVAVGCAKLGVDSRFIGCVGADSFGRFLRNELARSGVDVTGIRYDSRRLTRLAFISLSRYGGRKFEFHEANPADEMLRPRDVPLKVLRRSGVVHFSSFLLRSEPARSVVLRTAQSLRRRDTMVSFDPNLRLDLWESTVKARRVLAEFAGMSTILRLNEEEAEFLTGRRSLIRSAETLLASGPSLVVITRGSAGCFLRSRRAAVHSGGFRIKAVDTTGCGDGFLAGLLTGILRYPGEISDAPADVLQSIGTYANAVGAITGTRYGVINALPARREAESFIRQRSRW